jgi:hypothetical protein
VRTIWPGSWNSTSWSASVSWPLTLGRDLRGLGQRHRSLVAVVHLAAVLAAPQPVLQLADGGFEGGVEAVCAGFAAHNRAAAARGDLYVLTVLALAPVALMVEFDIEKVDGAVKSLEARELLGDVDAEMVGDLDVAALHDDLGVRCGCWGFVFNDHRAVCFHGTD